MNDAAIVESLRARLAVPTGRHLYAVLGTYQALEAFARSLQQARAPDGRPFPAPRSINRDILDAIPDDEFRQLAADEAKMPEPVRARVGQVFDQALRARLKQDGLVVLANLELLFAYGVELSPLRVLATDHRRIILLLPGRRERGRIVLFPDLGEGSYTLPTNLIADNHLWELTA
ncbi:MAG: hypothetical protein HYY04_01380 [Chloroflexi bacterium]|nr:hypothetical protein [Chloroflexota bacterium]